MSTIFGPKYINGFFPCPSMLKDSTWYGVLDESLIDEYILPDREQRSELIKETKRFKESIKMLRNAPKEEQIAKLPDIRQKFYNYLINGINEKNKVNFYLGLYFIRFFNEYRKKKEENVLVYNKNKQIGLKDDPTMKIYIEDLNKFSKTMDTFVVNILKYSRDKKRFILNPFETTQARNKRNHITPEIIEQLKEKILLFAEYFSISNDNFNKICPNEDFTKDLICGIYINYILDKVSEEEIDSEIEEARKKATSTEKETEGESTAATSTEEDKIYKVQNLSNDLIDKLAKDYSKISNEQHSQYILNALTDTIQYIDLSAFFLISVQNCLLSLDNLELEEQSGETSGEIGGQGDTTNIVTFENVKEKMCTIKKSLDEVLNDKNLNVQKCSEIRIGKEKYSIRSIRKLMKNFYGNIYYTPKIREALIKDGITNGIDDWTNELVKKINLNETEIINLAISKKETLMRLVELNLINHDIAKKINLNETEIINLAISKKETLDRLMNLNLITADIAKKIIQKLLEKSKETDNENTSNVESSNISEYIISLYIKRIIDEKDIFDYYMEGTIALEDVEKIKEQENGEEFDKNIGKICTPDELISRYKEINKEKLKKKELEEKADEDGNKEESEEIRTAKDALNALEIEKARFLALFKEYISKNINWDDYLIEYFSNLHKEEEKDFQKILINLYQDRLIDLDIIENFGEEYIKGMLDTLTFEESRKLREKWGQGRTCEILLNIFKSKEYTENQKLTIMMNLLSSNDEDKEKIDDFIDMLDSNYSEEKNKSSKEKEKIELKSSKNITKKDFKKRIYPVYIKWRIFAILDPKAMIKGYVNGYVEIQSDKLQYYVIERFYDSKNHQSYGYATYFLPKSIQEKNRANLYQSKKEGEQLNTIELRNLVPKQDRIPHLKGECDSEVGLSKSSWVRKLAEKFGYSFDEKDPNYDKQVAEKLNELANQYIEIE